MAQSVGPATLHGRLAELQTLDACLELTAAGKLHTVFVEGEAGIGKTRLVEAWLERARGRGFQVFAGGGDEIEQARPFGPLVRALGCTPDASESRRAEINRLLRADPDTLPGPIEPTRDPGLQYRIVDSLVDLIEEAALVSPVALALDDVQWADPSTVITVRALTRQLAFLPVMLVATLRPLPRPPEVERLAVNLVREGAQWLALRPLEDKAVAELVAELVAATPADSLLAKVATAAGNPLFVIELVKALADQEAILVAGERAELTDFTLPPSLRQTILRRTDVLNEQTLELLQAASVLGLTFSAQDVATVLGRSAAELLRPIRDAIRAKIFVAGGDALGFRHDLIRAAIYEDLPKDVRAALHLEAGRRLATAGAPAQQIAEQLALGARPGDTEAVRWLHAAAREAARQSPAVAVRLLERALDLAGGSGPLPPRLLADLVTILLWSGNPGRAETYARQGLDRDPPTDVEGTLRLGLVSALTAQGRASDVVHEVASARNHGSLAAEVRLRLQAEAANALAILGDLRGAEQVAGEAIAAGTPAGGAGAIMGLLVLSDTARGRGNLAEALQYAQRAKQLTAESDPGDLPWRPEIFEAMVLRELDRFEEAHRALVAGRLADERQGNVSYLPVYHYESATVRFAAGDWDDAVADAESGLALADDVGLGMLLSWPHGLLGLIAAYRGQLEAAAARVAAVESRGVEPAGSAWLTLTVALLQEARGEAGAALVTLERGWDQQTQRGSIDRLLGPDLVRLALAADRHVLALRVTADLEAAAETTSAPGLIAVALRCRGVVDNDADPLLRSVAAYRLGPRAFERAAACQETAAVLARAGRGPDASLLFEEALDFYDRAGARRQTARILAEMRALGLGRKRRGARKRPATGWPALTPSELEVVRLAARGLTNPEIGARLFISRRTVQTHLAHAFRKLGVASRVELAAEVARRSSE